MVLAADAVTAPVRIFLSAGDPSGDQHGAAVAEALRSQWPHAQLYGLGGPRMAEQGVELLADFRDLAVMGFAEVATRLPYFIRLLREMSNEIRARNTHLVLPIDYPGFNLRLAKQAHADGVPVLYYIAPQVWAWHRSRIHKLAKYADRLAVVLPFEEEIFREAGANVQFVGHPLLDREPIHTTREEFCSALGLNPEYPILALFPGSREQDVAHHLELFTATADRVRAQHPTVQAVIASADAVPASAYEGSRYQLTPQFRELLTHARAALVKSGTSTLEAAMTRTPMVIAYRMHPLSFALARVLVRVEHIGLVNLIAGRRLMPELIQDDANPTKLALALSPFLTNTADRESAVAGLDIVRERLLSAPDAGTSAQRVARLAAELIG